MKTEIIKQTNEETEYRYCDQSGDAALSVCHVFDGVDIIYNSVHMTECDLGAGISGNLIEIHHCREGRLEHECGDELVYLMPGDLSMSRRKEPKDICRFPLRHYHGITVIINEDSFSCPIEDINIEPSKIADRLCGREGCFLVRNQDYAEHIFHELYTVPEHCKKGLLKIKILELLFVLSWIEPSGKPERCAIIPKSWAKLACSVADYLIKNHNRRVPAEELASRFFTSETAIRRAFKAVYGVPLSSFMRIYKMQSAALRLIHTELSVAEIAGECGYDNPSKFASAFKDIMGETRLNTEKLTQPNNAICRISARIGAFLCCFGVETHSVP